MKERNKRLNRAILILSALVTWELRLSLFGFVFFVLILKGITLALDLIVPKIAPLIEEHFPNQ